MKARLLGALGATAIALLLAEGILSFAGIAQVRPGSPWFAGGNHPRFLFQPDESAGYELRPGFEGREIAASGEFDVAVSINRHGLRDHTHAAPPRPAILALGDSLTFGEGVPVDQAYPAVLEAELGLRTYNGGVPGYSSRQMRSRMRELLPALEPRLVILSLSPLWDASRLENPFIYRDGYIVSSGYDHRLHLIDGNLFASSAELPVFGPLSAHAKARSRLARLALPLLGRMAHRESRPSAAEPSSVPTARELGRAAGEAASHGAAFLAVLVESRSEPHRRARRQLEQRLADTLPGVVVLDHLMEQAEWARLRFPRDGHWNAAGHRWVAAALVPFVEGCLENPAGCTRQAADLGLDGDR